MPDFLRPLLVWKAAFAALHGAGCRLFGDRYALVRLEDLRDAPATALARIYALLGRQAPTPVVEWAAANVRPAGPLHLGADPRWARAARLIGLEPELREAGYEEILGLDRGEEKPLDLTPRRERSRLSGLLGRARRRLADR